MRSRTRWVIVSLGMLVAIAVNMVNVGALVSYVGSRFVHGESISLNNVSFNLDSNWWVVNRDDNGELQLAYLHSITEKSVLFIFVRPKIINKEELLSDAWKIRGTGNARVERTAINDFSAGNFRVIEVRYKADRSLNGDAKGWVVWSIPSVGIVISVNERNDESIGYVRKFLSSIKKESNGVVEPPPV